VTVAVGVGVADGDSVGEFVGLELVPPEPPELPPPVLPPPPSVPPPHPAGAG
jgi:hypothetical protein